MMSRGRGWAPALVLLAVGIGLIGCGEDTEPAGPDVLVTVNGDHVKRGELDMVWQNLPENERDKYTGPDGVKRLMEELVTYKLMAQEAERRRLDEDQAVKDQIAVYRQQVLVNTLVNRSIPQADVFEFFQRNFIRLRFIQIAFPEDASGQVKKAAQAKAEKIAQEFAPESDFSELARENSNADNAVEGGEMGYVTYDTIKNMVGIQAAELVRALKDPGDITAPVEGGNGWYIFQLVEPSGKLDHRGLSPDLDDAIRMIKKDEVIRSFSNELNSRKDNVITYNEPVVREIMDTVRENMERFKEPVPGETVAPAPGSTAAPEPGSTAAPAPPDAGSTAEPQ
jgi:peptidyl-prolyl cis-trans isomerase C